MKENTPSKGRLRRAGCCYCCHSYPDAGLYTTNWSGRWKSFVFFWFPFVQGMKRVIVKHKVVTGETARLEGTTIFAV